VWQFDNESWEQDEDGSVFTLKSYNGSNCTPELSAPLEILLGAKTHPFSANLTCSNKIYPAQFKFCPSCGATLFDAVNEDPFPWCPPYGIGNGLKITSKAIQPKITTAQKGVEFELPPNGPFSFFSARLGGKYRFLFAIQRDIGQIWVHKPNGPNQWLAFDEKIGANNFPNWAWGMAIDRSEIGCAFPTLSGPVWLTIEWITNGLKIIRGDKGKSIGSPIIVGNIVLAPIMKDDGGFVVLSKVVTSDGGWMDCQSLSDQNIVKPQLCREDGQEPYLGLPIADEVRAFVYWPCRGGYIKVSRLESGQPSWEFRAWEIDEYPATALIELGVPYRHTKGKNEDRGYWQLCKYHVPHSREGITYKIIKFDGNPQNGGVKEGEDFECGQFFSTGQACYSWHRDYWNGVMNSPDSDDQVEIRYPILQFGENGTVLIAKLKAWEGKEETGCFTDNLLNDDQKTQELVRLVFQGAIIPETGLYAENVSGREKPGSLFRISVSQIADISSFIYDAKLYIYFTGNNKCYFWPIEWAK
jgi:hypothetical protein